MKKKINKKNIPAYEFGLNEGIGVAGYGLQTAAGMTGDPMASGALSGLATGAAAGAMFGPIGAGVGAVVGGAVGLIGGNKKKNDAKKAIERQQNIIKRQNGMNTSALNAQEWYSDNPIANTYNYGGTVGAPLAFVNGGEIVQYPNGNTKQVQSKSGKTDDVLTSLPYGSKVFGALDATNDKSFAEQASKIHKNNKKAEKDGGRYAANSIKLNNMHLDELAKNQEIEQMKKNVNNKQKNIPAYANGYGGGNPLAYATLGNLPDYNYMAMPQTGISTTGLLPQNADMLDLNNIVSANKTAARSNYLTNSAQSGFDTNTMYDNLSRVASLAPVAYNAYQYFSGPDTVDAIQNPYNSAIIQTMANRRFDNRAIVEANKRQSAIANYNANQITGTGQNMAYRLANEAIARSNMYDVIAQTNNMNNQLDAQYADVLNNLGQQDVQSRRLAQDINMRNQAANKAYGAQATSQISQFAQTWNRDRNANRIQNAMLDAYKPYLQSAYTTEDLAKIYSQFGRR